MKVSVRPCECIAPAKETIGEFEFFEFFYKLHLTHVVAIRVRAHWRFMVKRFNITLSRILAFGRKVLDLP